MKKLFLVFALVFASGLTARADVAGGQDTVACGKEFIDFCYPIVLEENKRYARVKSLKERQQDANNMCFSFLTYARGCHSEEQTACYRSFYSDCVVETGMMRSLCLRDSLLICTGKDN